MELRCRECGQMFVPRQSRKPGPKQQKYCGSQCKNHGASRASREARWGYIKPGLEPRATPDDREIAWAAGFYEGEGWAGITSRSMRVSIGQKDTWSLERIRTYFGGTIDPPRGDHVAVWRVSGELARRFLAAIYPELSPRRRAQIDAAVSKGTSPVIGERIPAT